MSKVKAKSWRELALRRAAVEARRGVREQGNNRGPDVEKYQRADGLHINPDTGYPWCAAFVAWAYEEVGRPLTELQESASVGLMLNAAKQHGWNVAEPKRGDCVCFYWADSHPDWPDHIGIVRYVDPPNLLTVEGNTGPDGGIGSDGVYFRTRPLGAKMAYFRVPGTTVVVDEPADDPVVPAKPVVEPDEKLWLPGFARWWGDKPLPPRDYLKYQEARREWRKLRPQKAPKTLTNEEWKAVADELRKK